MTLSAIPFFIQCNDLAEATIAHDAVRAFRDGKASPAGSQASDGVVRTLVNHIRSALAISPLNRPREIILEALLRTSPETWLPYKDMQTCFKNEGFTDAQAQAALRDLSWQMKEAVPVEHLSNLSSAIEVLADRSRTSGIIQYRLTTSGRAAVEIFLSEREK
jgi:hypothetical protein